MVPGYQVWQIEREAAQVLRGAYPQELPPDAIDIEWVIEGPVGLEIVSIPGLRSGWGVDGVICRYLDGGYCVVVDQGLMDYKPNRYRFTLGEELGHYVLHRDHLPKVQDHAGAIRAYRDLDNWHEADRNARTFAAAVLMPMQTLRPNATEVYTKLVRAAGFGDPDAIRKHLAAELARRYGVSAQATGFRLTEGREPISAGIDTALQERLDWLP